MSGGEVTLTDLELSYSITRRKYIDHAWDYLAKIKEVCRRLDSSCEVLVFGSFVKGNMRPDSDVDVLVITRLAESPLGRGRVFRAIVEELGLESPFELHIVTRDEYEKLYKKFLDVYEVVP